MKNAKLKTAIFQAGKTQHEVAKETKIWKHISLTSAHSKKSPATSPLRVSSSTMFDNWFFILPWFWA
jgi:hypothetical protein